MERSAENNIENRSVFFILLGASDDLITNLKKLAIRLSIRLNTSIEYMVNMPMSQLLDLAQDIIEINEEDRQRRQH